MTTTPDTTGIRLSDPGQLIAALPALLGFHPADSLVLTCLHRRRIGLTMRVDLPAVREHWPLLMNQIVPPLARTNPSLVLLTVICGSDGEPWSLPYADLVDHVVGVLAAAEIRVGQTVWAESTAAGARWAGYDELPGFFEVVPDPTASPVAAATVAEGRVVFNDREELEDLLRPDPAARMAPRRKLLEELLYEHPYPEPLAQERFRAIGALLAPARAGLLYLDDERIAMAGSALLDVRVRDACLTWSLGDDADAAERLWTALVRALPPSHRADPAVLLAATAYLRGDGALAGIALDTALEVWPGHSFAGLLRTALSGGLSPAVLRDGLRDAEADAVLQLNPEPDQG